jgi:hypothetical protein
MKPQSVQCMSTRHLHSRAQNVRRLQKTRHYNKNHTRRFAVACSCLASCDAVYPVPRTMWNCDLQHRRVYPLFANIGRYVAILGVVV